MCGRYNLRVTPQELAAFFDLFREAPEYPVRYNIAPTQQVVAVQAEGGQREAALLRWGLIPLWASDLKIGAKMINARAETLLEKPAFKASFKRRRCLIPDSGFYEWKRRSSHDKQPYHIHRNDNTPLAFAGLWGRWDKGEQPIESCTIITTDANPLMRPLHDRMPVILSPDQWNIWLDNAVPAEAQAELLQPYAKNDLVVEPVSTLVNNARNDSPECVATVTS